MFRKGRRIRSINRADKATLPPQFSELLPGRDTQLLANRPCKLVVDFLMPGNGTLLAVIRKIAPAAVLGAFL